MPKIMVVDDDAMLREALMVRLRSDGFEVCDAGSAQEATRLILSSPPDLVLLDINMPSFDGLEFHECLRFADRTRNIPVVYLSGQSSPVYVQDAFRCGGRAFIHKPYNPQELIAVIRGILDSRHVVGTLSGHTTAL